MDVSTGTSGNLLDSVKSVLTPDMLQQVTRQVGEPVERVQAGVHTAVPALLAGVVQKGSSESGAKDLLGLIQRSGFDQVTSSAGLMERVSGMTPQAGQGMLNSLFGNRLGGIADFISRKSGLSAGSSNSLLGFLAPIVMGVIGMKSRGMGASGLMSMLSQQKDSIFSALPQGFAQISNVREMANERVNQPGQRVSASSDEAPKRNWVWPVVIAALAVFGLLWLGRARSPNTAVTESQRSTETARVAVKSLDQLNGNEVMQLQAALNKKGYNVQVDGVVGTSTHEALRDFQIKNNLGGAGSLNAATVQQLGLPEEIFYAH